MLKWSVLQKIQLKAWSDNHRREQEGPELK